MASTQTSSASPQRGVRWGLIALGLVVIMAGLLLLLRNVATVEDTLSFDGITRVQFDVHNAPVTITGSPDATEVIVRMWVTTGFLGGSTLVEPVGGTLTIVQRCPVILGFGCNARYEIIVPTGTTVGGETSNGAVRVANLTGDIEVRTSNGAISLENVSGRLNGRTSNGAIQGEGLQTGSTTLQTSNGRISLSFDTTPQTVEVRTSNGAIEIRLPDDAPPFAVTTSTSNGRVETSIRTDPAAAQRIDARTSNGNITIR
jgi:hypothetical protein